MTERTISFTLADLFDYEAQLTRDAALSHAELEQRDRALGPELAADGSEPRALLKAWLLALRHREEGPWPGEVWQNSIQLASAVLFLGGSLAGIGSVQALMSYDGSRPVNIVPFLGFFVALQLFLLFLALSKTLILAYARQYAPRLSLLSQRLLGWLERRALQRLGHAAEERQRAVKASLQRLRKLHGLLLERMAWQTLQSFGLGFFLSALLTFLYLIAFHDYAFAWSTTLNLDATRFQRWLSWIALPFSWISPELSPSQALLEATQYVRLEGRYTGSPFGQRARELALTRAWWPFLALCIVTYGVLPRFLLFLATRRSVQKYLAGWPFADQHTAALRQRLLKAAHVWQSAFPSAAPEKAAAPEATPLPEKPPLGAAVNCVVLRWFDPPFAWEELRALIETSASWSFEKGLDSRGTTAAEAALLEVLLAPSGDAERVLVTVHDPWELPGEAFTSLIKFLRRSLPRPIQVYCAPVEAARGSPAAQLISDESLLVNWRRLLAELHDPYVGLLSDQGDRR